MHERRPQGLWAKLTGARAIRLMRAPAFGTYMVGNGVALTGTWMQRLACLYLIWELTESGFWLGVFALVDMLPVVVLGLFAGAASDRWHPLLMTRFCQYAIFGVAIGYGVCAALGVLTLPVLMSLAAIQGCTVAVAQPARMALVQSLVTRDDVGTAVALSSVNMNIARLTGPAIAGVMLVTVHVSWIFFLNALLTLVFIGSLTLAKIDTTTARKAKGGMIELVLGGLRYAIHDRGIRGFLLLLFVSGFTVRSISELYPAFAARNFDETAAGLAALASATAIGAVCGGLSLGIGSGTKNLGRQISLSWIASGFGSIILAFSPYPQSDIFAVMVLGFFVTRAVISTQTFIQLSAPDELRGRVLSVHGLVSRGSPALGAILAGAAIDLFGIPLPTLALSVISILIALWMLLSGLAPMTFENPD